jgi:hypothetical protein
MSFILGKLKERSTWAGLAAITAALGWSIDPEQFAALAALLLCGCAGTKFNFGYDILQQRIFAEVERSSDPSLKK